MKELYTTPEMLELGSAAVLTLGAKGCTPDCEDCDEDDGGSVDGSGI